MNTSFTAIAALASVVGIATPTLAAKPVASDPCLTVSEETFPSFVFSKTIEVSQNIWATGTFLADASGRCTKWISNWPRSVNLRYKSGDDNSGVALVLAKSGNDIVVGLSSISFSANGPVATQLSGPTPVLDTTDIPLPPDLLPPWEEPGLKFGAPESEWISPDGTQLLMKAGLYTSANEAAGIGPSIVTCSLSYVGSTIEPIDPLTCREVHRFAQPAANWHEIVAWGAVPGTIYSTHPSSVDPKINSLYRLTVQAAATVVEEIFHNGGILWGVRATWDAATQKEIVAVYEHAAPGSGGCSRVIVIDAYDCSSEDSEDRTCDILNEKGMRSMTWLPDGRLAGRGRTPTKKGNGQCFETESIVAYPAIDPTNTPPTVLTTTPSNPYNLCRTCIEGSAGSW
jgi:hypothetical protein